jgi:hypothetical protein
LPDALALLLLVLSDVVLGLEAWKRRVLHARILKAGFSAGRTAFVQLPRIVVPTANRDAAAVASVVLPTSTLTAVTALETLILLVLRILRVVSLTLVRRRSLVIFGII